MVAGAMGLELALALTLELAAAGFAADFVLVFMVPGSPAAGLLVMRSVVGTRQAGHHARAMWHPRAATLSRVPILFGIETRESRGKQQ